MKPLRYLLLLAVLIAILLPLPALAFARAGTPRAFTIQARQFNYTPSIIRVQQGDTVKLTLVAEDVTHGLFIDG